MMRKKVLINLMSILMLLCGMEVCAEPENGEGASDKAAAVQDNAGQENRGEEGDGYRRHHHRRMMTPANPRPEDLTSHPHHHRPPASFDRNGSRDFKPGLTGGLKKEEIRLVLHQHASEVEACYAKAGDSSLEGRVGIHWLLEKNGSVMKVFIKESTLNNPMVEKCIVESIQSWQFPRGNNTGMGQIWHWFVFENGKYRESSEI